jgi:uncharacterized protein with FMN-binding domain
MKLTKTAATSIAALSLIGTLAGCAAAADTSTTTDSSSDTGSSDTDSGTTTDATSDATYTDGTYDATASYQSPNGTETIDVELTLADGTVTAVTVTGEATGGDSQRYQSEFSGGIAAEVVGKNIDELSVDKVAGSSLTSGGFNDAVEQIKAEALA